MADIWRVVATKNSSGKLTFDFAIATPQKAELAHIFLMQLRQSANKDDTTVDALAPMFLEDGKIQFSENKYNTPENQAKLKEMQPLILCEFNKFRTQHPDWNSSFDDMDKDILAATIYKDVNIFQTPESPEEAKMQQELARSRIPVTRDPYELGRLRHLREGD